MRANVRAPLKNPVHRGSRPEEAQIANGSAIDQSLVTSVATIAFAAALLLAGAGSALGAVSYVDVNSTNSTPPYTSWATAATNIQDAVDAAVAGDEIVVTNGIYASGGRATLDDGRINRVAVDKALNVRSVNGPVLTFIQGAKEGSGVRCVYLTNSASLSGFTLTKGLASAGGGVFCASQTAVLSNCVVSGNSAYVFGMNDANGGGAFGGTLNNCVLIGNSADDGGGGAAGSTLNNCTLTGNSGYNGGGAENSTLNNCTLIENSADHGGGAYGSTLNNCIVARNLAAFYWIRANDSLYPSSGGYGGGTSECILNNCVLSDNSAVFGGGASGGRLNNCTLTGNSASVQHGSYRDRECGCTIDVYYGGSAGGVWTSTLNNCIVYFNTGRSENHNSSTLNYSCTTPLPTNGVGNLTNAPLFVSPAAGNYRLRPDSPCIDAGTNLSAGITNDLDGRPRPLDGNGDVLAAFDMGAYEYRTPLLVWQDSPNPGPPHADWANAAHTIQDAVDAAVVGDEIVVTNGIYATGAGATVGDSTTNRVTVDKPLSLRSVNGSQVTTIDGGGVLRCVYLTNGASLSGFTLTSGLAISGGGLWCESTNAVVSNCVLAGNQASYGGGAYGGTLNNCTLTGNSVGTDDLGEPPLGGGAYGGTLNNCTLSGNSAGYGGGAYGCTLNNCTLTGNEISGRFRGGGAYDCALNNCIVYFNTRWPEFGPPPLVANYDSCTLNYSCTTPQPTNGVGNITNAPLFVDQASANFRLQSNSPCINAGRNALAPAGLDLDGNPRIAGGTVDIGAYEFQAPTSAISYAWLQQFNLPIDSSTDLADPDADRMSNWQEWRCATDPTNALSALRLRALMDAGSNVIVTWQSAAGFNYSLERSVSLAGSPPFTSLAANLTGQTNTTSYTDTNAVGAGPFFYRVAVGD